VKFKNLSAAPLRTSTIINSIYHLFSTTLIAIDLDLDPDWKKTCRVHITTGTVVRPYRAQLNARFIVMLDFDKQLSESIRDL
jgi:hypothetical protein